MFHLLLTAGLIIRFDDEEVRRVQGFYLTEDLGTITASGLLYLPEVETKAVTLFGSTKVQVALNDGNRQDKGFGEVPKMIERCSAQ